MTPRGLWLLALLTAASAFAQEERSQTGVGRVALQGGYRWSPNGPFQGSAAAAGHPVQGAMGGGPQFSASFGYAPLDWLEATIDVFVGFETFKLQDFDSFTSTTYGALLGVRIGKLDFPFRGLLPYFGAQLGPALGFVSSKSTPSTEHLNTGYSLNAGASYRLTDKWGIGLDARYLFANATVADLTNYNAGGLWISFTVTFYLPATPKDPMGGML